MFNIKTTLLICFFCVAISNASPRGLRHRRTENEAAAYNDILFNLDEVTVRKIHERFLMDKIAVEHDARDLQEEEGSMSLSLSMSLSTSSFAADTVVAAADSGAPKASKARKSDDGVKARKAPKAGKRA